MSKVYLVHSESGEWSDWTFVPLAVFTTREKAVEWIEGQRVPLDLGVMGKLRMGATSKRAFDFGQPSTTDGKTWEVTTSEGGMQVDTQSLYSESWFIDELELDPTKEETE